MIKQNHLDRWALAANQKIRERGYWLEQLAGGPVKGHFPFDHAQRHAVDKENVKENVSENPNEEPVIRTVSACFDRQLLDRLTRMGGGSNHALHIILAAALAALLDKYTGEQDIIIGTPIYKQEVDGEFINTVLPLRYRLAGHYTFKDLLLQSKQVISEAVAYQSYPVELLANSLNLPGENASLFDTALLLENIHDKTYFRHLNLYMTFVFTKNDDSLNAVVEYNSRLYRESTVRRIISHLQHLLENVLADVEVAIADVEILSEEEKKRILHDFNDTAADYPRDKCIHELFTEQAARVGDQIALVARETREKHENGFGLITYRELNEKSNRLAQWLIEKGVKPDAIVGIMVERSLEMIIGIIGILKSGGAYLPINPEYPQERIDYMLKDSGAGILINKSEIRISKSETNSNDQNPNDQNKSPYFGALQVLNFEHLNFEFVSSFDIRISDFNSSNLAYIIYTSGTTGKPKGVLIEHRNVVRLLFNDRFQFDFNNQDVWSLFHSYSFDFSVWEMYGSLLYGGRLLVIPRDIALDPVQFLKTVKKHRVTVLNQTPSAFYNFVDEELKTAVADLKLRYVIFGGEALKPGKLEEWYRKYPYTRLVNMFGITETTVHVTYKEIGDEEIALGSSNIGKPIPTLGVYILDRNQNPTPTGAPGELYVGGEGVARGYLNRPELTVEKFGPQITLIDKSFSGGAGGRFYKKAPLLYRSGDLARLLENGDMEYLGRMDHQVQLHGFRIELGEIESLLLGHEDVADVVVSITGEEEEAGVSLCAYVVPTTPGKFNISDLREYLATRLPGYMMPSYFVELAKIPLTPNGKVDREALPGPTVVSEQYIAPRTPLEQKLAELWAQALKLEKLGINDNYFNIGGDSIKAIQLVSLINSELKTSISIVDLYTHGTIENLAEKITHQPAVTGIIDKDKVNTDPVISKITSLKAKIMKEIQSANDIADIYPMTDIEKGIAFYYLKNMGTGLYHDQFVYPVAYRDFDIGRMKKALAIMMEKHSILRANFNIGDYEEHVQIVYKQIPPPVQYFDLSGKDRPVQETFIKECCLADRKNPFNLNQPPLWRMMFFKTGEDNVLVLFVFHHAILDGWSVASLLTEVHHIYLKLETAPGYLPRPLAADYKDAVISEILEKQNIASSAFWKKELAEYNRLNFSETVKSDVVTENMKMHRFDPGPGYLEKLKVTAKNNNTSVKNLCFAAYVYIMSMLSNEEDIVVGNVSNNRPITQDGDKILGCFLNTLPVRVKIPYGKSWTYYMRMMEEKILALRKYERLPLFEIARVIGEKSKDKNPIFDTLFNFKNFHVLQDIAGDEIQPADQLPFAIPRSEDTNTLFDFEVDITGNYLLLEPKYRPLAMNHKTVEKSCLYFKRIIDKFINDPDSTMSRNDILTEEEKQQLLYEFNDTRVPYAGEKTMHQLFEEQVSRAPEGIALVDRDGVLQWTYDHLNKQANRMAGMLRKKGLKSGGLVSVIMDRSVHMVMAVMGILKAGGAYVPLEPYLPDERIRKLLESLRIETVIVNGAQLLKVTRISQTLPQLTHLVCPDKIPAAEIALCKGQELVGPENLAREDVQNPAPAAAVRSGDIAYVIFTSGSTGTPKGVVETHRPVINVIEWVNKTFAIGYPDKLLFVASLSFDLSVYDIFGILASGACLRVVAAEDIKNPETLLDIIMNEDITFWDSAPAALQQLVPFLSEVSNYPTPGRLRLVFLSGDWIPVTMPQALREAFKGVRVISLGGATEATVWSNYYPIGEVDPSWPSIPYGKPIQNAKYYILDKNLELSPLRVPGDLYIGGECLAKEYINDIPLSAHKFIANPFVPGVPGEKMYRTGDIARWLEDGNMQFLGRKDHQVKIRGYRIELGEIESRLLSHPAISDGIVLDRADSDGNKYLCAYYVCRTSGKEIDREELKEYLSQELPEYMLPAYFIAIPKIPLTANGKLDRKGLPEPEAIGESNGEYTAPENETQVKLVEIWSQVLGVEKKFIGITADFFQLGGHSLNATMVISRVHKELNVKVPLAEIFNSPTIRELARKINTSGSEMYAAIEPVEKKEYYRLSSAQRRLYFLQQMEPGNTGYNIQEGVMLEGIVDIALLEKTFRQLIQRHESLRTSFEILNEETVQRVYDHVEFAVELLSKGDPVRSAFIRSFDLSKAPLMRVGLLPLEEGKHLLLIDMHHIISDGVSHAVLKGDFGILYSGGRLPAIRLQYKDYSEWRHSEKQQQLVEKQKAYWLEELSGDIPVLNIPTDYPRPMVQNYEGNVLEFDLGPGDTKLLNQLGRDEKATLYMVLVAIYNILLYKLGNREEIIIGTPTAGRRHSDLERIIGMFVNTLVLKNYPADEKTFTGFLQEIKDKTIKAFENQDFPFEELVEKRVVKRDASRNPLFDVAFVLQNMEVEAEGLPGAGTGDSSLKMRPYPFTTAISKFDMTLIAVESGTGIHFTLEYCTKLFKEETVQRIVEYFKKIVRVVTEMPGRRLADIEILSEEEKKRLLQDFNDTAAVYPRDKTIPELFAEQAQRVGDKIAVIDMRQGVLTYRKLNEKSAGLAQLLMEKGVKPGTIVGIMLERSLVMIIGIIGILKSGGAYLPIDPKYPQERIDYMLKDSGARILINKSEIRNPKPETNSNDQNPNDQNKSPYFGALQVLNFEHLNFEFVSSFDIRISDFNSSNLAYIIYTSGSTGNPKGVMIEHHSVVNRLHWMQKSYPIGPRDVILQKTPIVFDVSVWELFWWSMQGASLCLLGVDEEKSPGAIITAIARNKITTIHFVPSMLQVFLEHCEQTTGFTGLSSLKQVFSSGEALGVPQVEKFNQLLNRKNGTKLINLYGPTEATVDVSYYNCIPGENINTIPIGRPIDNIALYVVDKNLNLQPIGVTGELCISGVGLARGYVNRPELTVEKFVDHRHSKLYRTGDMARVAANGQIEYLGRIDHQVKIRGFRIELGEIENRLLDHEGIKGAVVLLKDRHLYAYIAAKNEGESEFNVSFNVSRLRSYLLEKLPDYMIPSYFVQIAQIPLTVNGKVDRKALDSYGIQLDTGAAFTAPQNELEKKIANAWKEVLHLDKVGIHDNYFELGGTSFDIIKINRKLKELFEIDVPVVTMFRHTTIHDFAAYLDEKNEGILDRAMALERGRRDKKERLQRLKGARP